MVTKTAQTSSRGYLALSIARGKTAYRNAASNATGVRCVSRYAIQKMRRTIAVSRRIWSHWIGAYDLSPVGHQSAASTIATPGI